MRVFGAGGRAAMLAVLLGGAVALPGRAVAGPEFAIEILSGTPKVGQPVWFKFGISNLPDSVRVRGGDSVVYNGPYSVVLSFALDGDLRPDRYATNFLRTDLGQHAFQTAYAIEVNGLGLGPHTATLYAGTTQVLGNMVQELAFQVLPAINLGDLPPRKPPTDIPIVDPLALPTGLVDLIDPLTGDNMAVEIAKLRQVGDDGTVTFTLPFDVPEGTLVRYPGDANNAAFEFTVGVPAPIAPFTVGLLGLGMLLGRGRAGRLARACGTI